MQVNPENMFKRMIQPHPGRCAPEEVIVLSKTLPDGAGICAGFPSINTRHAESLEERVRVQQQLTDYLRDLDVD